LNEIISSFNVNTNLWAKTYVFKRLIFLKSKTLSSIGVLFFLALWHGFDIGYFMCFSLEFLDMETERRWAKRLEFIKKSLYQQKLRNGIMGKAVWGAYRVLCWFLQTCALHYAMVAFELLRYEWCIMAWRSLYFSGHWIVFGLLFLDLVLPKGRKADVKKIEGENEEKTKLLTNSVGKSRINGSMIMENGVRDDYLQNHKE
jgi:lysophospholipid acyltransferase 5